jgi:Ferritin-like domain
MDQLDLHSLDADGAIAETRAAAQDAIDSGDTRMDFLRKGALAGGAAISGGAILGALMPGAAMAAGKGKGLPPAKIGPLKLGNGDVRILNYALALEYLESTFYNEASKNNVAKGDKQLTAFLKTATKDENAHVKFLKSALKGAHIPEPKFKFGSAVKNKKDFAAAAYVFENTGVHAYLGQAGNIKNPAYLLAAASIVTVEARHSGAIGLYLGKAIAPTPFDTGLPASTVIKAITPFVVL